MSNKNDIGDHECSGNLLFADLGHRLIKRILENVDMSEPDSSDIELSLMRIIGERDRLREQIKNIKLEKHCSHEQISYGIGLDNEVSEVKISCKINNGIGGTYLINTERGNNG